MLRYGIPAFRLPRQVLDAEISMIRSLGAEFRLGKRLGRDFTLDDLQRDFDAVFLAIGAQGSRGLGCPGEELATPALEFLEKLTDGPTPAVGSDVIIVGGGNTAMDASRCAVRLGAKSVRVLYRRTRREMPCLMEEVEAAEAEGVQIEFLVAPVRLERKAGKLSLTCQRMELGPPDESGRARPVPIPGSEFEVQATCVIAAIGQSVDLNTLDAAQLTLSKWGIAADPKTLATNLPGVFAGGDAVTGPDLAVRAVAAGKLAAASIDQYLSGKKVIGAPESVNVLMGKLSEEELAVFLRGHRAGAPRADAASADGQAARPRSRKWSLAFRWRRRRANRGAAWAAAAARRSPAGCASLRPNTAWTRSALSASGVISRGTPPTRTSSSSRASASSAARACKWRPRRARSWGYRSSGADSR